MQPLGKLPTNCTLQNLDQYSNFQQQKAIPSKNSINLAFHHTTQFIRNFSPTYRLLQIQHNPLLMELEKQLAELGWKRVTYLCELIESPSCLRLKETQTISFFLGKGLCLGIAINYFSIFFATQSITDSSPFPLSSPVQTENETSKFYPFDINEKALENQSKQIRFLHAAYKVAIAFKAAESLEFLPNKILKNHNINITQRIPDSQKPPENIERLLPLLKQWVDKKESKKNYLLDIGSDLDRHALVLHLKSPFHFVDPPYGVGTANDLGSLLIFLAAYLTKKYPDYYYFNLLELEPLAPIKNL